jgi:hypothetical protein
VALLFSIPLARPALSSALPACPNSGRYAAETIQGEGVEPTASVATAQKLFTFRSGFWINLHHYLLLQAVMATPAARKGQGENIAQAASRAPEMSAAQKAAWSKAAQLYLRFGNRDPLRDQELILINYELSDAGNSPSLKGRRLSPELAAALEEAAPVYRALWWPEHDLRNRAWIQSAAKLVEEYGPAMSQRVAAAFQIVWPAEPTPVEVVLYANWAGAYTVVNSTLITISSSDPAGQGPAALESLFHEASHAFIGNVERKLDAHLRAAGKTPTFDIVHVIIFYTAGAAALEVLRKNAGGYIPYALKNGLYDRVPNWNHYREICEKDWQPYLDGRTTLDAALAQIAGDL